MLHTDIQDNIPSQEHRESANRVFARAARRFSLAAQVACVISSVAAFAPAVHAANTWQQPFATNSIWNTKIGTGAVYVNCNLGVLGGLANDRENLIRTNGTDPYRTVNRPDGVAGNPGVNVPDSLLFPAEANGGASFILPDGVTSREFNYITRTNPGTDLTGWYFGDTTITGDGIHGAHAGASMSVLGGTIRIGELESANPIGHALKFEVDWAVLYRNANDPTNQSQTYRWPASNSDGNFGGSGSGPNYTGTNPALKMGALVALPKSVNINSLGLSAKGVKIAQAFQDYGAYIVNSTGNHWQWGNGGYTGSICIEKGASAGYLRSTNDYLNNDQLYNDMNQIYQRLAVIDNNGPNSIGGGSGTLGTADTSLSGSYTLAPACSTGSRLDANGSGTANGTKVQIWAANGTAAQTWNFVKLSSNIYKIQASYSPGLVLDVNNAGSADGTVIQLWGDNGSSAQQWAAYKNADGSETLVPQCATNSAMDVSGSGTANGTQVQVWTRNGGNAQKWSLTNMGSAITNVAQGKAASASSSWDTTNFTPAKGVDNNIATGWSPSGTDTLPWLEVDLGQAYTISQIKLVTRQDVDQVATRRNFTIWASNNPDMSQGHVVLGTQGSTALAYKATYSTTVTDTTKYRYIAALKTTNEYFFISELQVMGR